MNDFTEQLIADVRRNRGQITGGPLAGTPVLILTTTGARSGKSRTTLVDYTRDGDAYVVAASKGGAPTNPAWYYNLRAHPDVIVEVNGERFAAKARVTAGGERDRLWNRHVEAIPVFGSYPAKTSRVIPMVVVERAG